MNIALIIANQEEQWEQISGWLQQIDLEIIHTPSWGAGLKELKRNPEIEFALLDADATDDYGTQFLTIVRRNPRLSRIPVIVGGREFADDMVRRYTRLKVTDILVLPTEKETLIAKAEKAIQTGRPAILVADDEEMVRLYMAEFLLQERYRPVIVSTAADALETLKRQPIDAVVTDINLPGYSGLDLLIEIKHSYPHIPVIMITGYAGKFGPTEILSMGADGYFTKPFHNLELMYTLHRALTERPRPCMISTTRKKTAPTS